MTTFAVEVAHDQDHLLVSLRTKTPREIGYEHGQTPDREPNPPDRTWDRTERAEYYIGFTRARIPNCPMHTLRREP